MNKTGAEVSETWTAPRASARHERGWTFAIILFAISLQVLATIEVGGNELRFGTSDLLLPVLLLLVLWKWLKDDGVFPDWRVAHFWVWVGMLTFWIGFSVVNGRLQLGEWQAWAVVNKGIGWLILVAYLLLGGWIAAFYDARLHKLFVKTLILCTWISCGYSLVLYFLYLHRILLGIEVEIYTRLAGFFANPNAFGIFCAAVLVLQAVYTGRKRLFSSSIDHLGLGVIILSVVLAGSRSAWLGLAAALPVVLLTRHAQLLPLARSVLVSLCLGAAIIFGPPVIKVAMISIAKIADIWQTTDQTAVAGQSNKNDELVNIRHRAPPSGSGVIYIFRPTVMDDTGLDERIASFHEALTMWRDAPITGTGLGSYRQRIAGGEGVSGTIHNSLLWLLAETGLIGGALFSAFFLIILRSLYLAGRMSEADPLLFGVFGVLLVLAGASIGTEIMYQRYLWFLTGLALALPRQAEPSTKAADTSKSFRSGI